jgi:hypothetical protein
MQRGHRLPRAALLMLVSSTLSAGGPRPITWEQLSSRLTPKHRIRIVLPDGVRVEASPVEVRAGSLELNVTRTSEKRAHPKGPLTVPRASVKDFQLRSPRSKGRWIGAAAGAGPGIAIMAASANIESEFNIYILLAGAGAAAVGVPTGFFIGRAIDRRFERFVISGP